VRTAEGVVLAVEKRLTSPLLVASSVEKIFEVDAHIGFAISGLAADARTLVEHGRVECQAHRFSYDEPLRVESLTQALCDLAMSFGEGSEEAEDAKRSGEKKKVKMSRPFGVSLLIAGVDARGPQLYHMDPSGTYISYAAHAIGAGAEGAVTQLVDKFTKTLTLEQAKALVTRVLSVRARARECVCPPCAAAQRAHPPSPPRGARRTRWKKNSRRLTLSS
jgi:20S proteasome subunit alpha 5